MHPGNIFVMEDGDVLEIGPDWAEVTDRVTAGPIFVDGRRTWGMMNGVLKDRRLLSQDGIVVMVVTQDARTGSLLGLPEMVSSGFIDLEEQTEIADLTAQVVMEALSGNGAQPLDRAYVAERVKEVTAGFLRERTGRRPMIVPVVKVV